MRGAGTSLAGPVCVTREDAVLYLVSMTTRVPDGTSPREVDDVRAREAVRTRQLAGEGHLLRLWRPPLKVGEWRTLGLFAAEDDARLEELLASMPLRMWRTDEVTPLTPHPNDPGVHRKLRGGDAEFLIAFVLAVPPGTSKQTLEEATAGEAVRSRQLAAEGRLVCLWVPPARGRVLGLYRAHDIDEMKAIIESLPLKPMMTAEVTPLVPHPNDPGNGGAARDAEKSSFADPPAP